MNGDNVCLELPQLWESVMLGKPFPICRRMDKYVAMTFMPHRQATEFHTNIVPCPSDLLAIVIYNQPADYDRPWNDTIVTGWKIKVEPSGKLRVGLDTFALRKVLSRRMNIDDVKDEALKRVALEADGVRRSAAEAGQEIWRLCAERRSTRLNDDQVMRLKQLRREEAALCQQPRVPQLLTGIKQVNRDVDLDKVDFFAQPGFRREVFAEARTMFERGAMNFLEQCADGDEEEHWKLLSNHAGSEGLGVLFDRVVTRRLFDIGKMTFIPSDFLPSDFAADNGAQFLDLRSIGDQPQAPFHSKTFLWPHEFGVMDDLQLHLDGASFDFSTLPERKASPRQPQVYLSEEVETGEEAGIQDMVSSESTEVELPDNPEEASDPIIVGDEDVVMAEVVETDGSVQPDIVVG